MENANRILNLLSEGLRPSKIAAEIKVPTEVVVEELTKAIEERRLPRSRVLETLDKIWRDILEAFFPAWKKRPQVASPEFIHSSFKDATLGGFDLEVEEVRLYLFCLEKGFKDGEIYEVLCELERCFHTKISQILIEKHGAKEVGWWRQGIPVGVRTECVQRREADSEFVGNHSYSYTTLGNLAEILKFKPNQALFKNRLPLGPNGKEPNLEVILKELEGLRKIRNRVMHPIGAVSPTEEDFFFAKEMLGKFDIAKWR